MFSSIKFTWEKMRVEVGESTDFLINNGCIFEVFDAIR